jgi:hypothetical protein
MSAFQPFSPHYGTNQILAAAVGAAVANIDPVDKSVRIVNTGSNPAYVRLYKSDANPAPSASTADFRVQPGSSSTLTKADGQDRISYISALGTNIEVMTGEGW